MYREEQPSIHTATNRGLLPTLGMLLLMHYMELMDLLFQVKNLKVLQYSQQRNYIDQTQ